MRNSKLGLRALGLAILGALSLTAFFAASAQATSLPGLSTVGQFLINLGAALLATLAGAFEDVSEILVAGRNLTISCSSGSIQNGKIDSATDALGVFLLEKCDAWNFQLLVKLPCLVLSPGENGDSIAIEALVLPILHGGVNYVLLEPLGLNLVTIELHGASCPLPLNNPVKGSVSAEVVGNHAVKPLIKFSPTIQLLTGDVLTFGGFSAYIDASVTAELTGNHLGDTITY